MGNVWDSLGWAAMMSNVWDSWCGLLWWVMSEIVWIGLLWWVMYEIVWFGLLWWVMSEILPYSSILTYDIQLTIVKFRLYIICFSSVLQFIVRFQHYTCIHHNTATIQICHIKTSKPSTTLMLNTWLKTSSEITTKHVISQYVRTSESIGSMCNIRSHWKHV